MLTRFLTILMSCALSTALAQNVTVINNYNGGDQSDNPENFVLSNVTTQTYIINEYERANVGMESLLHQMIEYGITSFIDANYYVKDGDVNTLTRYADFEESAVALVRNAIWIHDLPFSELFEGYSPNVLDLAEQLSSYNGYSTRGNISSEIDVNGRLISLYAFQRKVFELKKATINESMDFVDQYLPASDSSIDEDLQGQRIESQDYSLDTNIENREELTGMSLNPDLIFEKKPSRKKRKSRNEFSDRVVELLEENNRILANYSARFEDLQRQIDEIKDDDDSDLRSDMAEMRDMIEQLAENRSGENNANFRSEYFIFDKNKSDLSEAQKVQLNRVGIIMAKNPSLRVLITGFADKSGNPEYNVVISRKRAESVKNHLLSMGIDSSRILVSYVGDTESTTTGPADRRVEVDLLD